MRLEQQVLLKQQWGAMDDTQKKTYWARLNDEEKVMFATSWIMRARPPQFWPQTTKKWFMWLMLGGMGAGKAIEVDTPILTANRGWSTMGDLLTGDYVFAENGRPYPIVTHTPYFSANVYSVNFDDGASVITDGDHLWRVGSSTGPYEVLTTESIKEEPGKYFVDSPIGIDDGRFGTLAKPRYVLSVDPARASMVRCISVDSPNNTYLVGEDFITTHNTQAGAWFIRQCILEGYKRPMIVGRTSNDVMNTLMKGPAGLLKALDELGIKHDYKYTKRTCVLPDYDVEILTYAADAPEQFRGPEHDCCWMDEQCSWQQDVDAFKFILTRMRSGKAPKIFSSTTPDMTPLLQFQMASMINAVPEGRYLEIYDEVKNPGGYIWVTSSSTFDNRTNLAEDQLEVYQNLFGGTRFEEQFLQGRVILDVENALWTPQMIEEAVHPVPKDSSPEKILEILEIVRVVVGVDPTMGVAKDSDETGIVVVGINSDGRAYVLDDLSGKMAPDEWAKRVCFAYNKWKADRVIAEKNQGGDLVKRMIQLYDPNIPYVGVSASKGKITRAEPISALYEQGKIKHVKAKPSDLSDLEKQMYSMVPGMKNSPDRVDALVWALSEIVLKKRASFRFLGETR